MSIGRYAKRILSCLLSCSICLTGMQLSVQEAKAGIIEDVVEGEWSSIAGEAVERTILFGLDKAAESTESDSLSTAIAWTQRIIGGREEYIHDETMEVIKDISEELDALYAFTVNSDNEIKDLLNLIISNEERNVFNEKLTVVTNFGSAYEGMLLSYSSMLDALKAWGESPTEENKKALKEKYDYVYYHYYEDIDVKTFFRDPLMGDATSEGFLATISPYSQNQTIASKADLTGNWKLRSGLGTTKTYLDSYYSYLLTVTDFENNVYDSMSAASQLAANAGYQYIQAYRYYAELASMLISTDSSLTQEQKDSGIETIWSDFDDAGLRLIRGLNQMVCLYDGKEDSQYDRAFPNVYGGYMRDYDVEGTVSINNYHEQESLDSAYFDRILLFNEHVKFESDHDFLAENYLHKAGKIKRELPVYQFRLASDAQHTGFAVMKRGSGDDRFLAADTAANVFSKDNAKFPTLDLFNLRRGTKNGYESPGSIKDLAAIYKGNSAYEQSGNLTGYLNKELGFIFGSGKVDIPVFPVINASLSDSQKKKGPGFLALRTECYYEEKFVTDYHDTHTTWANISMPCSDSNDVKVDLEDDILEECNGSLKDTDILVMYKGTPFSKLSVETGSGGTAVVTADGSDITDKPSTASAGKPLLIRVKPDKGNTIDRVCLSDTEGKVLECPLQDIILDESTGRKLTTQEQLRKTAADQDGFFCFEVPVPCRDAKVTVSFREEDPSLIPYKVTLNDVTGTEGGRTVKYASAQFGGYDYIGEKSFTKDSYVTVSVTGYYDHIAQGLTVKDKDGNVINNMLVRNITPETGGYSTTERVFSFKMPEQDVQVDIDLGGTYKVTVNDTAHITHSFSGLSDALSRAASSSYVSGETVKISFEAKEGYELKKVSVFDPVDQKPIPVSLTETGIAFRMPAGEVLIRLFEEKTNMRYNEAYLDLGLEDVQLNFIDAGGLPFNVSSRQAAPGSTLYVKAEPLKQDKSLSKVLIRTEDGQELSFEELSGSLDKQTGIFSLVMPSENIVVSAVTGEKAPNDISDTDNFILTPPQDTVYNGSEQKMPVRLTASDGTLLKEGRDYDIEYSDAVNIGTVSVNLTGRGSYTGIRKTSYRILAMAPECRILEDPSKVYDGKPAETPGAVCDSGSEIRYSWYRLREDGSQILLEDAPVDAGEYRVGAYAAASAEYDEGAAYLDFTIEPATAILDLSAVQEQDTAKVRGVVFGLLSADGTVTFNIKPSGSGESAVKTTDVVRSGDYYLGLLTGNEVPSGEYTIEAVYKSSSGNYTESSMTKTFTEGKRRTVTVDESVTRAYGDANFTLQPATLLTNGQDEWSYEIVSDDFPMYPVGTAEATAEKSVSVTQAGTVSVKHAGTSVIKITLKDVSDARPQDRYYETSAYVTVKVNKAPLTVTSFSLPDIAVEGGLSDVTYALRFSGLKKGDTRLNFTHGFGTLSAVPVPKDSKASDTPYKIGIQKNGVTVRLGSRTVGNVFVSRDYDVTYSYGSLTVTGEPEGKIIPVKRASFDENELHLGTGETASLSLTLSPANTTNTAVVWRSEDEDVAVIDTKGLVTAKSPGTAVVKAIVHSRTGKLSGVTSTASCKVYVRDKTVQSVALNTYEETIYEGDTLALTASVCPEDAGDTSVTFTSSDPAIASVASGIVTANAEGSADITASAGTKKAVCRVRVINEIDPRDMEEASKHADRYGLWTGAMEDIVYTGEKIEPEPRVYYGKRRLKRGFDYTLSWRDNINAGTAYVTVSPKGSFGFAKKDLSFKILPGSLEDPSVRILPVIRETVSKNGISATQKLTPEIYYYGRRLKPGKDYAAYFTAAGEGAYQKAGSYEIKLEGRGNFTGTVLTSETLFDAGERLSLSRAKIRLKSGSREVFAYDPAKPDTAVTPSYELYYTNVKDGISTETVLTEGRDYVLTYRNNQKPGKASAVFTAKATGAYFGSKEQSFKINKVRKDIAGMTVSFPGGRTVTFEKGGTKPEVLVMDGDMLLKEGTDYTVSYKNNRAANGDKKPEVIIKGRGFYSGKHIETFNIVPAALSDMVLVMDDFVYSKKADAYKKVKYTLTDRSGRKLDKKDYKITGWTAVSSRPKPGTCVEVTFEAKDRKEKGSGAYEGLIYGSFRVIEDIHSFSRAKVKIAEKTYEGHPVTLEAKDFTVSIKQQDATLTPVYGEDFVIVSYQNNNKAGTAKVTLRGTGSYGGLKTVSFKIRKSDRR